MREADNTGAREGNRIHEEDRMANPSDFRESLIKRPGNHAEDIGHAERVMKPARMQRSSFRTQQAIAKKTKRAIQLKLWVGR